MASLCIIDVWTFIGGGLWNTSVPSSFCSQRKQKVQLRVSSERWLCLKIQFLFSLNAVASQFEFSALPSLLPRNLFLVFINLSFLSSWSSFCLFICVCFEKWQVLWNSMCSCFQSSLDRSYCHVNRVNPKLCL